MAIAKKSHKRPDQKTKTSARSRTSALAKRKQQQKKRYIISAAIIAFVAVVGSVSYFVASRTMSDAATYAGCTFKIDTSVKKKVVSGFFFYTTGDDCQNRKQLQNAHSIGANYVLTFGARLMPVSSAALSKGDYANFKINNSAAYKHIQKQTDGGKIRKIFTYNNKESYSSKSLSCGKRDGVVVNKNTMYTWWLFPVNNAYSDCTDKNKVYDLVVSLNKNAKTDANTNMINNAKRYGMHVYLGLPSPNTDSKNTYLASSNKDDRHTLGSFTARVLRTWNQRHGNTSSFKGTYLTLESLIGGKENIWQDNYKVYSMQSQLVGWGLPSSKRYIAISPYTNGNLSGAASSMRTMVNAAKKGSGTKVIMMPQDGVGTGYLLKGSSGGLAKAKTLYTAARQSGATWTWANLEAFVPGGGPMPSNGTRFKQQLSYAKQAGVGQVIVYEWNTFSKSGVANRF